MAEVAVGKSWGDIKKVWNGLKPDGLSEEDEEALEIGEEAPWFPYFEHDTGVTVEEREPVTA